MTAPVKRGRGRPSKLTAPVKRRILAVLRTGGTRALACARGGIDTATFHRWLNNAGADYREFSSEIERAEADAFANALARIDKAAKKGDWRAAKWLLERRMPDDYGERQRVEHTGQIDVGVIVLPAPALTADSWQAAAIESDGDGD